LNPDQICYFIIDEIVLGSVYISAPRSMYIDWSLLYIGLMRQKDKHTFKGLHFC